MRNIFLIIYSLISLNCFSQINPYVNAEPTKLGNSGRKSEIILRNENAEYSEAVISTNAVKFVSHLNEWVNIYDKPLEPIPAYAERYTFSKDSIKWIGKYYFRQLVSKSEIGNDFIENRRIFREVNKKIYEGLDVSPGEALVYDFNLNIGDSTKVLAGSYRKYMVCTKIDTVIFLDGNIRKRQEMQCIESNKKYVWIEGFGEMKLYHDYCQEENEKGYVSCYYYDKAISYSNSTSQGCWINETDELDYNSLSLSPNPTNDIVKIETQLYIDQVRVYDLYGHLLNVEKDKSMIDLSNLTKGIYILEINIKNKKIIKKVVKI